MLHDATALQCRTVGTPSVGAQCPGTTSFVPGYGQWHPLRGAPSFASPASFRLSRGRGGRDAKMGITILYQLQRMSVVTLKS